MTTLVETQGLPIKKTPRDQLNDDTSFTKVYINTSHLPDNQESYHHLPEKFFNISTCTHYMSSFTLNDIG